MSAPKVEPSVADWRKALRGEVGEKQANRIADAALAVMWKRRIEACEQRAKAEMAKLREANPTELRALRGRIALIWAEHDEMLKAAFGKGGAEARP